ncbi:MAG: integration host factor subunit alpha [Oligoflexia bacterium]|nr:integration host factor subunit alpha [Oligoflexia bacterium]
MTLTKSDITNRVFRDMGLTKKEAVDLVELVFKTIKDTLSEGERVKISGFGNFFVRDKGSRRGRNPQTGHTMEISARRVINFRSSQVLREDITSKYAHRINEAGDEDTSIPPNAGISRALNSFTGGEQVHDDDDHNPENELDDDIDDIGDIDDDKQYNR